WQHTGSYLRILRSYARDATPILLTGLGTLWDPGRAGFRDPGANNAIAGQAPPLRKKPPIRSGRPSLPLDLHHFVGLGAAWRDHFDLRAFCLADQGACER